DAAFAQSESAESIRRGDLTSGLHYSGLGLGPASQPEAPRTTSRRSGVAASGAHLTRAKHEAEQARRDATRADADAQKAQRALTAAEADLKRLRAAVAVTERQATKAHEHVAAAEKRLEQLRSARGRP
ncbi:MAG TPA: hypothetical protein VMD59_24010, partial [Acidimicrobiales bacterium]|nr:hypothetical protein [Acidimicrobiales bacterium]